MCTGQSPYQLHFLSVDNPGIASWLETPLKEITFSDRIETLTETIRCDVISLAVRDMVKTYSCYKEHRIFLHTFHNSLTGLVSWDAVITAFNESVTQYDLLVKKLNDGMGYYIAELEHVQTMLMAIRNK